MREALRAIGHAADPCWLTFFLRLPSDGAEALLRTLRRLGLQSDDPPAGRYAYLRMSGRRRAGELCKAIGDVGTTCASAGADLVAVDLDDSAETLQSRVVNLFSEP